MRAAPLALALSALVFSGALARAELAPSSRFATLDGLRVHYTNYGAGERALVFVHGWSSDETVWKKQAPELAKSIRVLTIDLPGHGQSDQPPAAGQSERPEIVYTMDYYARALDAVLHDAGVKKAVLVGHSNGTPVVRQFYRRYPEQTSALVIVDGSLRPLGTPEEMEKFIAPFRGPNYAEVAGKFIDSITAPMKDPEERVEVKRMMLRTPQRVAVSEFEATFDQALWSSDRIDVPTLVVLAKSPFWTDDYLKFVRELAPKAQIEIFEGVSHFLMLDKPREFNETLLAFLKKNSLL
jgi:pimeloyl-ACP methyl ester carboxylesterase